MENSPNVVLTSTSREGDFVHESQPMAAEQGFRNVSGLWYPQTMSYDEGVEALERDKADRADINEEIGNVGVKVVDGALVIVIQGRDYTPTMHAMEQLATWCDTPHTLVHHYFEPKKAANGKVRWHRDAEDLDIVARALNLGKSRMEQDKPMLLRTYNDGTLRAVLSDRYAIVDNRWYLETLRQALPGGRLSHWRGNADTIFGNVLIPDSIRQETDSEYGGMLSVANCEIGIRMLWQLPSIFRAICMNGCIWGQKTGNRIKRVHRGKIDLDGLRVAIIQNVHEQIPLMGSIVDTFLSTRGWNVTDNVARVVGTIANDNRFSPVQAMNVMEKFHKFEQGDRNAFGIINAITRAGQDYGNQAWVDFDTIAGKIVAEGADGFEKLNRRASLMTDEQLEKTFASE